MKLWRTDAAVSSLYLLFYAARYERQANNPNWPEHDRPRSRRCADQLWENYRIARAREEHQDKHAAVLGNVGGARKAKIIKFRKAGR